ncbi:hypothetical protein PAEH1_02720 [Paenalcaligenes hominis]|uniref:Uncharacterized protein n=1 Tax=Paenalcaligenes hominis TaxID=643674 RepID=A0A1U9JY88_9BURK|nr:hypothetical protein [Paenalcaligenes hominis]AQS50738.1 hypothetical protein PAEH1_02720 [Paenalcaligenes hominis]
MRDRKSGSVDFTVGLLVSVACAAWSALWLGLAFSVLWALFAAPFLDVDKIGIAQACGLVLMLRVALFQALKINGSNRQLNQSAIEIFVITPFAASFYMLAGCFLAVWL